MSLFQRVLCRCPVVIAQAQTLIPRYLEHLRFEPGCGRFRSRRAVTWPPLKAVAATTPRYDPVYHEQVKVIADGWSRRFVEIRAGRAEPIRFSWHKRTAEYSETLKQQTPNWRAASGSGAAGMQYLVRPASDLSGANTVRIYLDKSVTACNAEIGNRKYDVDTRMLAEANCQGTIVPSRYTEPDAQKDYEPAGSHVRRSGPALGALSVVKYPARSSAVVYPEWTASSGAPAEENKLEGRKPPAAQNRAPTNLFYGFRRLW